jgi:hypothetical protein
MPLPNSWKACLATFTCSEKGACHRIAIPVYEYRGFKITRNRLRTPSAPCVRFGFTKQNREEAEVS